MQCHEVGRGNIYDAYFLPSFYLNIHDVVAPPKVCRMNECNITLLAEAEGLLPPHHAGHNAMQIYYPTSNILSLGMNTKQNGKQLGLKALKQNHLRGYSSSHISKSCLFK